MKTSPDITNSTLTEFDRNIQGQVLKFANNALNFANVFFFEGE